MYICCVATCTHTHIIYIYMYDGLPKCLFLVLLINRNSFRAASYLAFRTITYLNSLKPCISFFTFEAVAKTLQHMLTHVCMKEVPLLVELEYVFYLLQGLSLPLLSLLLLSKRQGKLQVLWWRLGQGSTKAVFWNLCKKLVPSHC